jgi:DNA-binding HxlR family transcriptional regulator
MNQNDHANEIPKEVRSVIKGLNNETRLAIIVVLMKNGKMTFSELKESLALNSSSLSNHLSILQDGGLVNNVLEWKENSYSYYTPTDIANRVLESLFNIVVQTPRPSPISDSSSTHNVSPKALLEQVMRHKTPQSIIKSVSRYR